MYLDLNQPKNLHVNRFPDYAEADGQGSSRHFCSAFVGRCPMVLAPLLQLRVTIATWGSSSQFHTMTSQGFLIETAGLPHLGW